MVECKGGRGAVGAGGALKDFVAVSGGAESATDVGTEGVFESDRVSNTEICG